MTFFIVLIVIAALIAIEAAVIFENHLGLLAIALLAAYLAVFTAFNPFVWVVSLSGWTIVTWVVGWFLAGLVWSFPKWYLYLKNVRDSFTEKRLQSYRDAYAKDPKKALTFVSYLQDEGVAPVALHEKMRISVWMVWWPFSIVETFFKDIVRRFYNWVVDRFIKVYDAITAKVFQ